MSGEKNPSLYGIEHFINQFIKKIKTIHIMSVICRVCLVFPPLVSIFGLFPVLVKCDYELILVQLCLSHYLWLSCVLIVLSVQFDFVWSTHYSPVFLSVSTLPYPALFRYIKDCYLSYILVCVFLDLPSCVHLTHNKLKDRNKIKCYWMKNLKKRHLSKMTKTHIIKHLI